jgi:RNA polymerase sigma-70 factor (sigma-E family)
MDRDHRRPRRRREGPYPRLTPCPGLEELGPPYTKPWDSTEQSWLVGRLCGVRPDFTRFYESEAPRLVRSVSLVTGEPVLAEDSVAEAFARAWSRWPEVSAHPRPAAWVMRVALNEARSRFRRRGVERRKAALIARPEVTYDPQPQVDRHLGDALRELPRNERTLIALRYVADLSQAEIANVLGVPPGTVASGLSRARHKLGAALGSAYKKELT